MAHPPHVRRLAPRRAGACPARIQGRLSKGGGLMSEHRGFRRVAAIISIAVVSFLTSACGEPRADTANPKSYERAGLRFEHPGNWQVSKDVDGDAVRYVFVETPGNALVIIQAIPEDAAPELADYARSFSGSAQETTSAVTFGASVFSEVTEDGGYQVISEQVEVTLLGEDIPHTRIYRRRRVGDRVCFVVEQVSEEDRARVVDGFEQIASSLRYNGS